MKFSKQQLGATMWETSLYIFVFLSVITIALKLGPLYIDDMSITTAIDGVHADLAGKDIDGISNSDIKERIDKYFQVSMISGERFQNIQIERATGKVMLKLDYDIRQNFIGNVDVVVRFNHEVNLSEPPKK